jgi:hypothetical protein
MRMRMRNIEHGARIDFKAIRIDSVNQQTKLKAYSLLLTACKSMEHETLNLEHGTPPIECPPIPGRLAQGGCIETARVRAKKNSVKGMTRFNLFCSV